MKNKKWPFFFINFLPELMGHLHQKDMVSVLDLKKKYCIKCHYMERE